MCSAKLFPGCTADTMRKIRALAGTEATLGCLFDKSSKQVEWSALTVEWNVVNKHAGKSIVYTFEDGMPDANREGSEVDEMRLLHSDASLLLRNVTVRDEGLYTCRVITPVVHTETTSLEVLGMFE